MKNIICILFVIFSSACTQEKIVKITISNPLPIERINEIVEISSDVITPFKDDTFIISDNKGMQVPYQLTHDNKIIFPVSVAPKDSAIYKITRGTPDKFRTIACGKQYPERVDDIAWENDRIAFRTYGPALQVSGEKAYGCDVWVKCISDPVVDLRYKTELDPEIRSRIAELNKTNKREAQKLAESVSYHIDHGNGLDFYKVGPTLGAGTSALLSNDSIIYPYCYKTYEILDNGPLRFTVKLTYNPVTVKENHNIIETRLITLDAGSQLNKYTIHYDNLKETTPVLTGIVMHAPSEDYQVDAEKGYITYAETPDPTNGQIFIGAVFPDKVNEVKAIPFSPLEKTERDAEHF